MATEWILGKLDAYPPALQAKAKAAGAARTEMFRNAVKLGVKIALGTDAAVYPHGQNAKEFKLMVDLGMPPIEALRAGTSSDADLLGIAAKPRKSAPWKKANSPTSSPCPATPPRTSPPPNASPL